MTGPDEKWDRFRIKAEIQRRGSTLTQIAIDAGIAESSCRTALLGASRAGAEAISGFLGVPLSVLFPGLYLRSRPAQGKTTPKPLTESRQKNGRAADRARATA